MLKNAFYIALFALISWGIYQLSYPSNTPGNLFYEGIFMENITAHVDKLTQGNRAVGDYYHDDVQRYLIQELNDLGLTVTQQKSTAFNPKSRTAAPVRNILAKKTGSTPTSADLLIMAHYDAAKFFATGAADAASGVAVILETMNGFIKTNQSHSNDIIVLFTDAEEIGLLGAHAFINEQLMNHDIGLIINLEARGSSGPVMMWPETVGGNRAMIEGFTAANVPMSVTTSLHYEIYKMLPNDTDMTPFNQLGKINGFNLAFIDDYHNYHTQLDNLSNLSLNTLAHQAIQLHGMLKYFANDNLQQMQDEQSLVYFTLPNLGVISHPIWLTYIILTIIALLLLSQIIKLCQQPENNLKTWLKSILPITIAIGTSYAWSWLLLKLIAVGFPEHQDILHGFPYTGHAIMTTLLISSALVATAVFGWFNRRGSNNHPRQGVIAIGLWLVLLIPATHMLPGSGFLVWPVLLSLGLLMLSIHTPKLAEHVAPIFATLTFILMGTVLINLPIAMGLAAIPITAVVVACLLALFMPVISPVKNPYHGLFIAVLPLSFLVIVLIRDPSISETNPHPTSLSYLFDHDSQQGYYFNFDEVDSGWNTALFQRSLNSKELSEYWRHYKKPMKNLTELKPAIPLKAIEITAKKPLLQRQNQFIEVTIKANRNTSMLEIFTTQAITLHGLSIDNRSAVLTEPQKINAGRRLLRYFFDGKKEIKLQLEVGASDALNWQVQSHSIDLLNQAKFNIPARPAHQIPKPFITTDNTIAVQSFAFGPD